MGVNRCAAGKGVLVKRHLRVMLRIAVPLFRLTGGKRQHDGRHGVADVGEVLRTSAL